MGCAQCSELIGFNSGVSKALTLLRTSLNPMILHTLREAKDKHQPAHKSDKCWACVSGEAFNKGIEASIELIKKQQHEQKG